MKRFVLPLVSISAVLGLGFAPSAFGIDYSGTCQGVVPAAGSPHRLVGFCSVPSGQVFTFEPGASIDGQRNSLSVAGTLNASMATFDNIFVSIAGGSADLDQVTFGGDDGQLMFSTGSTGSIVGSDYSVRCLTINSSPEIRDNDITASQGVCVNGGQPMIVDNRFEVASRALVYNGASGGTAQGNTISFSGTSGGRIGVLVNGAASPTIRQNTFEDDPEVLDRAISLSITAASSVQVTDNDVCASSSEVPVVLDLDYFADASTALLSDNTFSCATDTIGITGALASSGSLVEVEGKTTVRVVSFASVGSGATLSIPDGWVIDGGRASLSISGGLVADGVRFDSLFLSVNGGTLQADDATFDGVDGQLTLNGGATGSLTDSTVDGQRCMTIVGAGTDPLIEGNTISGGTQGVCISSGAAPTIRGNSIEASSVMVQFNSGSGGTLSDNTLRFFGTSTGRRGIVASGSASPMIVGNRLLDDDQSSDKAISALVDSSSSVEITGNDICITGDDVAIELSPDYFADASTASIAGNTLSCDGADVRLTGAMRESGTLREVEGARDFQLSGFLSVAVDKTLSVPAGFSIDGLRNSISVAGGFVATDADLSNLFLSVAGDLQLTRVVFGGQDGQLSFTAGATGSVLDSTYEGVRCLSVANASPLIQGNDFVGVMQGVCANSFSGGSAVPTVRNNVFVGAVDAIRLAGTAGAVIEDNVFDGCSAAIQMSSPTKPSLQGNTFIDNDRSLTFSTDLALDGFPDGLANNIFEGASAANSVLLPNRVTSARTFAALPVHYEVASMSLNDGADVLIQPGAVVHGSASGGIFVNDGARFRAAGSEQQPVVLTAESPKSAASWRGLDIAIGGNVQLSDCVVEFAVSGIFMRGGSLSVADCSLRNGRSHGIFVTGEASANIRDSAILSNIANGVNVSLGAGAPFGSVQVSGSSIFGNGGVGVSQTAGSFVIPAERNYWGDDSGPRDSSDDEGGLFNPTGLGQSVSDRVDYDPWLRTTPSVAGTISVVSGAGQSGMAGATLPEPVVIEVASVLGSPLEDVAVVFSVIEGDAVIVQRQPRETNANGQASSMVQLGMTPGPIRIAVSARDLDSPLATFLGEVDGPCIIEMKSQALRFKANPGRRWSHGDVDGDGYVDNADAAVLSASSTLR